MAASPAGTKIMPFLRMYRDQYGDGVRWKLLEAHEHQALLNHGQTLEKLSRRGGLAPGEMVALIQGRKPTAVDMAADNTDQAVEYLRVLEARRG